MNARLVTVGILAQSAEALSSLRSQIRATSLGTVALELTDYCRSRTDQSTRRFLDTAPDIILIDADEAPQAVESVQVLHAALPAAWVLVSTDAADAHTILEMVRAGAREFIPRPATQENLMKALQRHIEERDRQRKNEASVQGKMYSVCSAKSGSGATTVAINLSAALAESPKSSVALIDLDRPLGDVATYLNINPRFTVSDALRAATRDGSGAARMDRVLLESYMLHHDRIRLLAGCEDFEPGEAPPVDALTQLLEVVTETYTHSVVDLPVCSDREQTRVVMGMSAAILVVLTPDIPSVRRTDRLLKFLSSFAAEDKIRLIVNRTTKSDEITERDIEKALKHEVSWKVPNDYNACKEAIHAGKAFVSSSSKQLARNFRDFSQQLAGFQQAEKRKGLLSLLPKTSVF